MENGKGATLVREFEAHKKYGQQWLPIWEKCIDNFNTRHITAYGERLMHGERKRQSLDKTGIIANRVFGAGMFSFLAPNDQEWAAYQESRPWLKDRADIKEAWQQTTDLFRTHLYNSNWQQIGPETMEAIGCEGTKFGFLERGKRTLFNFRVFPIGTCWADVDAEGRPNTVYREFKMTAQAARDMWPDAYLGDKLEKILAEGKENELTRRHDFVHIVKPREKRDKGKRDKMNMAFESYYLTVHDKHVIDEGGYNTFPYFVVRGHVQAPEIYGRSPAMDALDLQEVLNVMITTKRKMAEIAVNPDIKKKAGSPHVIRRGGGKVTLYDNDPNEAVEWETRARFDVAQISTDDERDKVRKLFHNDLFELLAQQDGQMTAYEVGQRVREKLVTISPLVGRIQNEFLQPVMARALDIMNEEGMLDGLFPQDAEPLQYKIIYSNRVSLALQAISNDDIIQGLELVRMVGEVYPEATKKINPLKVLNEALENIGFPQNAIRPDEEVEEILAQEAQMQQAAMTSELANQGADTLNKLPPELREQLQSLVA